MQGLTSLEEHRRVALRYIQRKLYVAAKEQYLLMVGRGVELGEADWIARGLSNLGYISQCCHNYKGALERYLEATGYFAQVKELRLKVVLATNLGFSYIDFDQAGLAQQWFQRGLALEPKRSSLPDAETLHCRLVMGLGLVAWKQEENDSAATLLQEALTETPSANADLRARLYNNLGVVELARGRFDQARAHLEASMALLQSDASPNLLAGTYTELGRLHYCQGDLQGALDNCIASVQGLLSDYVEMDQAELAQVSLLLARILRDLGHPEAALEYYQRAVDHFVQTGLIGELAFAERSLRGRHGPRVARASGPPPPAVERLSALLAAMDAMEAKDPETRAHSERVAGVAMIIAEQLGLSAEQRQVLALAGRLHDVGKVAIPDEILKKAGALTASEMAVMRAHPTAPTSLDEMLHLVLNSQEAVAVVKHHHERWDGLGYPDGLKGEAIPYLARIAAAADVYDALTSDRSYRIGMRHSEALQYLKDKAGEYFDPAVVAAFERCHDLD